MTIKDQNAFKKVERAKARLLITQPFWGTLCLQLKVVEVNDKSFVNTMAVDGKHLYYYPPFIHTLSDQLLVSACAHEVSHCAYLHMTRRGSRHPTVWNWAGDYRINWDLKEAGFPLGDRWLLNERFKNMTSEEIYEILWRETPKIKITLLGNGGAGKNSQEDKHGCGGVIDAQFGTGEDDPGTIDNTWEGNIRMAAAVAKTTSAGRMPGYLERLVNTLNRPKVSWKDLTRQFIDESMSKDFSWARPNRRSVGTGCLLPGLISDSIHHLVVVIDHSGSISKELFTQFVSEVQWSLDDRIADHITLMYADDGVRQVDEFMPGDLIETKVLGGGGTNFRPSFDWIKANAPDASCVIYLTDLYTSDFGDDPGCPVLWGVWGSESAFPELATHVPFGSAVFVQAEY